MKILSALIFSLIVAFSLPALLSGCGGGDEPCRYEVVTLDDGRTVPAPNNCPAPRGLA